VAESKKIDLNLKNVSREVVYGLRDTDLGR
jgi:hypothetical protein